MTGRVKDFYHDEICNREQEYGPEPSDLEMLQMDAERASERYLEAKRAAEGRQTNGESHEHSR